MLLKHNGVYYVERVVEAERSTLVRALHAAVGVLVGKLYECSEVTPRPKSSGIDPLRTSCTIRVCAKSFNARGNIGYTECNTRLDWMDWIHSAAKKLKHRPADYRLFTGQEYTRDVSSAIRVYLESPGSHQGTSLVTSPFCVTPKY